MPQSEWYTAKDDPKIMGRFLTLSREQPAESRKAGKKVYKDELYCEITPKGIKADTFCKRLKTMETAQPFIERFPEAWADFEGQEVEPTGTPLNAVPGMETADLEAWARAGIRCAEDFLEADDAILGRLGFGAREQQKLVREYFEGLEQQRQTEQRDAAKKAAAAEHADKDERKPKKRGRPPKQKADSEAA